MHFWIDKRSPQCGFGRSRVAASLSGAGGGAGVSFGHPPRRSGGNKSSSSSSAGIHRQQQQQQQQPQAAQYHQQHGSSSLVGGAGAAVAGGSAPLHSYTHPTYSGGGCGVGVGGVGGSSGNSHSNNNNNSHTLAGCVVSAHTPTNRNHVRTNNTGAHQYYNNNRQYHHQQQQQQQQQMLHHSTNPPNSSNNNHSSTTAIATATTTQNNVTSPIGNNINSSLLSTQSHQQSQQQQNLYQQQRYRHPQFGNMSVRTYHPTTAQQQQQQQQQQPGQSSMAQSQNSTEQQQQQQPVEASLNVLVENTLQNQSPNQTANMTAELYQSSPRVVTVFPRPLSSSMPATCDHNSGTVTTSTPRGATMYASNSHAGSTARRRNVTRSIESADLQFLPLHLKCGIFASLVLAMAFIVGIKVYFDNHGTKFEVGLFWLLTAIFVFAFCFVSICKVPRVLFVTSSASSRSGSRDQTVRDRCSLDETRGSMVNSIDDVVVSVLHEFQQQEQLQQQLNQQATQAQQAGPPPYHIAILLPESKAKEDIEPLEESPPPSYDKILI